MFKKKNDICELSWNNAWDRMNAMPVKFTEIAQKVANLQDKIEECEEKYRHLQQVFTAAVTGKVQRL